MGPTQLLIPLFVHSRCRIRMGPARLAGPTVGDRGMVGDSIGYSARSYRPADAGRSPESEASEPASSLQQLSGDTCDGPGNTARIKTCISLVMEPAGGIEYTRAAAEPDRNCATGVTAVDQIFAEFVGTALLVLLGNAVVANVFLEKTKGHGSGWIVVTFGWGMAVFVAVTCVMDISGRISIRRSRSGWRRPASLRGKTRPASSPPRCWEASSGLHWSSCCTVTTT